MTAIFTGSHCVETGMLFGKRNTEPNNMTAKSGIKKSLFNFSEIYIQKISCIKKICIRYKNMLRILKKYIIILP